MKTMNPVRRRLAPAFSLALTALAACSTGEPPPESEPVVTKIEGAPAAAAKAVGHSDVPSEKPAMVLSSRHGAVALGTSAGLLAGTLADDAPTPVQLVADEGGPTATGAVDLIARRSDGGLFVHGEGGLFHDLEGFLVPSPLQKVLADKPIVAIDTFGEGDAEELWIATSASTIHVVAGTIDSFDVDGATAPADVAIGAGPGQAVVSAGGEAFFVDLAAKTVTLLAKGLGKVHGHDRAEDETIYLATDAGLFARTRAGAVSLRTLAPAGQSAVPVLGVAASFGTVVVTTASALVQIDPGGATTVGALAGATGAVAVDANGDVWAAASGKLTRFATGDKVSFAADVKPFFAKHCSSCHAKGTSGAPKDDFLDYATAKERSATILKRLAGAGVPAMPPPTTEVLTPSGYAVITRWVGGGLEP